MTDAVRRFLAAYAEHRDAARIRALLVDPERLVRDPASFAELPSYLQSMFLNQSYPQSVKEAAGGGFELEIRLLLLPGVELDEALPELLPDWILHGVQVAIREPSGPSPGSSPDDPTFMAIDAVLRARFPEAPIGPWLPDGSITDARFVRPLGVPAFGFSPFPALSTDTLHIGRPNERIDLPSFLAGVEMYSELLARLAAGGSSSLSR